MYSGNEKLEEFTITTMLLDALMENVDKDKPTVYNREIYRTRRDKAPLSVKLKMAGDLLEHKSQGWIKREYDPSGYHFVWIDKEVKSC